MSGTAGPHIFDNMQAALEEEVLEVDGHEHVMYEKGTCTHSHGIHAVSLEDETRHTLMVKCAYNPTRVEVVMVDERTGEIIPLDISQQDGWTVLKSKLVRSAGPRRA